MPALHRLSRIILACLALVLVGCSETGGGGGGFAGFNGFPGIKAQQSTRLAGFKVIVEGPTGFCIDRASKVSTSKTGFVVLGACASISDNPRDVMPPIRAVLTVSVSHLADGSLTTPEQIADFLTSSAGQATLAHSGRANHVVIRKTSTVDGAFLIQVRDASPNRSSALADKYWRGMFIVNGHLFSLTVAALQTHPFADSTGQRLLQQFIAQMRQANPVR